MPTFSAFLQSLRNPVVLAGMLVDLLPIYGVLAWGWKAAPLVMLYWIENLIAGVMTLPRIFVSGARMGLGGALGGLLVGAFFLVHYGLFCFVHGIFLVAFFASDAFGGGLSFGPSGPDFTGLVERALASGEHLQLVAAASFAFQVFVFVWEFGIKGGWRTANPLEEMGAPYGRIIVLHIGIFAGAFALAALGQPMVGVLALILFKTAMSWLANVSRDKPKPAPPSKQAVAATPTG